MRIRQLVPEDASRMEAFLATRRDSSMFLRANARHTGLCSHRQSACQAHLSCLHAAQHSDRRPADFQRQLAEVSLALDRSGHRGCALQPDHRVRSRCRLRWRSLLHARRRRRALLSAASREPPEQRHNPEPRRLGVACSPTGRAAPSAPHGRGRSKHTKHG